MSLEDFKLQIESLSGVKRTRFLNDGTVLQVVWQENPHNYSQFIEELRDEYPGIAHIEAPADEPTRTADQQPINYYTVQ